MRDRAGFFTGCADALTEMCFYYVVAGMLIMARRGWGVHLGWLLLCTALCAVVFSLVLQKARGLGVLTVVTGVLFAAVMAVLILVSETPMTFGYGFVLAVGAGMAVGCPLNYTLNRPVVHKHLARLDVLILVLAVLLLCREALGIDTGTVVLVVLVLFMDAAGAVGLRMTEGGAEDSHNAFKASMVALGGAAALSLVIGLLVVIFSRSGEVTGAVLRGIGAFFRSIGQVFERFFLWLSGLIRIEDDYGELPMEEMGSVAEIEHMGSMPEPSFDPMILGVIAGIVLVAAVVFLILYMRKKTFVRGTKAAVIASDTVVRRKGGALEKLWARLKAALHFRWMAFVRRNTPGGVLVYLERVARRKHKPRHTGESMRQFLWRMDAAGGLEPLADALDREYYGAMGRTMTARTCRQTRNYIRKVIRHG